MTTRIHRLTPMVHVADVEHSIRFYALFGLALDNKVQVHGRTTWAMLGSRQARLMLTAASGPILPEHQAIILYLYSNDIAALRAHLLANGVHDGGPFTGATGPNSGRSVVFNPTKPFYMPEGELRVHDPDAHCLLVGQAE